MTPKDDVEASATAMASMRTPHRGDMTGMARMGQPIMHGGADPSSRHRRLAAPFVTGNEQKHAVAGGNRLLQREIDRGPCTIEVVAMEIEHSIGLDAPAAKAPVPAPVKRGLGERARGSSGLHDWSRRRHPAARRRWS
jgi:hypothetical protein